MPLEKGSLLNLLNSRFPDAEIELIGLVDDNDHWALEIASAEFSGKGRLEQHRMVYEALQGKMGTILHALQIKTKIKKEEGDSNE